MNLRIIIILSNFIIGHNAFLQSYYGYGDNGQYYQIDIDNSSCGCEEQLLGSNTDMAFGFTFCPNGNFYYPNMDGLLQMDLTTGDILLISSWPLGFDPNFLGIAAETDSTFFLIENPSGSLLMQIQ